MCTFCFFVSSFLHSTYIDHDNKLQKTLFPATTDPPKVAVKLWGEKFIDFYIRNDKKKHWLLYIVNSIFGGAVRYHWEMRIPLMIKAIRYRSAD